MDIPIAQSPMMDGVRQGVDLDTAAVRVPTATHMQALDALFSLHGFMGQQQLAAIGAGMRSEEKQYFFNTLVALADRIGTMPKTYEQDGKGGDAVAYLHYFKGGGDWYITEKDMEAEQAQAFGLVDLGFGSELGYISLVELTANNVELDFHFAPTPLRKLDTKFDRENTATTSSSPSMR